MPAAIDGLLQELWDRKGTDVHLTAGAPPLLRLDGVLVPVNGMRKLKPADIEKVPLAMIKKPGEACELMTLLLPTVTSHGPSTYTGKPEGATLGQLPVL